MLGLCGLTSVASAFAGLQNGYGITVDSQGWAGPRLIAVTMSTPALPTKVAVDILLPVGYTPLKRYPVLYMFDGSTGQASDWTGKGDAAAIIGNDQVIAVMPEVGVDNNGGGWCTNWPDGTQNWETYHIKQLVPWVQENFSTINTRSERAMLGMSEGGYCALAYSAQFPDMFSNALSFSGEPDLTSSPAVETDTRLVVNGTELLEDGIAPNTFLGDPTVDQLNWEQHDPSALVGNLRWTRMSFYWGNGQVGSLIPNPDPLSAVLESLFNVDNIAFEAQLKSLGMNAYFDPYGNGTHGWAYWIRDLYWAMPGIMHDFEYPAKNPSTITYKSDWPSYTEWGWTVQITRAVSEFSTISNANAHGFSLSGSGSAAVTTPADYTAGSSYRVTISGQDGTQTETVKAGRSKRLTFQFVLGPSNTTQEFAPGATTHVYTTTVGIAAIPAHHRTRATRHAAR